MIFTGKNKKAFEKWLGSDPKYLTHVYIGGCGYDGCEDVADSEDVFDKVPFSMQQGVYLEYLDSLQMYIKVWYNYRYDFYSFELSNSHGNTLECISDYSTRQEALTEAFKKANELINNK